MTRESRLADDRHCLVGREVMLVVFENDKVARGEQSIGRVSNDEVDLLIKQGTIEQAEIENPRGRGEPPSVDTRQGFVPVRTLHKLIPEAGAELRSVPGRVAERLQVESACILATNNDRKGVVESQGGHHFHSEPL